MNYILTVNYYPIGKSGVIICRRRTYVRFFSNFTDVKRKLRFLNRTVRIIDYHIEERPAKE